MRFCLVLAGHCGMFLGACGTVFQVVAVFMDSFHGYDCIPGICCNESVLAGLW